MNERNALFGPFVSAMLKGKNWAVWGLQKKIEKKYYNGWRFLLARLFSAPNFPHPPHPFHPFMQLFQSHKWPSNFSFSNDIQIVLPWMPLFFSMAGVLTVLQWKAF